MINEHLHLSTEALQGLIQPRDFFFFFAFFGATLFLFRISLERKINVKRDLPGGLENVHVHCLSRQAVSSFVPLVSA